MDVIEQWISWLGKQVPPGRWHDKIYSYCERGGDASFWAEPVNAWTNGAFLLAAFAAFVLWVRAPDGERRISDLLLTVLVVLIGIGSFLFHTNASRWSSVADVLPITVFMLAYFGYALRRFFRLPWLVALVGVAAFYFVLNEASQLRCDGQRCFNGSVAYLPALGVLLLCGVGLMLMRRPAGISLLVAGVIFAASLTFRTFDREWCRVLESVDGGPLGTHFMWHILNSMLLFVLLRAAVYHGAWRGRGG